MNNKLPIPVVALFIIILAITPFYDKIKFRRKIKNLTSIDSSQVTIFRIFPRVIRPVGASKEFQTSDRIITDFFKSLADLRPYRQSHDTVTSLDHSWFLEIVTRTHRVQIDFHIPSKKGELVAGKIGKWDKNFATFYGGFQSRKLYQWYQKYSHRWLESEGSQPTPTLQPDPPGGE